MTEDKLPQIGAIVLAAGGSSRLGHPKQLLQYEGTTLLRRTSEMVAASVCDPIIIVLGAEHELIQKELEGLSSVICINSEWQGGMSSSIKAGLRELLKIEPDIDAVMITLCDQPHVTTGDINNFAHKYFRTHAPIIAAQYDGIAGVPALFSRAMFGALFELEGDKGARDLIRRGHKGLVTIDLQSASTDIDTADDVDRMT